MIHLEYSVDFTSYGACKSVFKDIGSTQTLIFSSNTVFQAMFTLYRIGFCSVSKVAPIHCKQELMFSCGVEIVPMRSQCEHKPHPSYNLQRSLLISKDHFPVQGSVAISAPIKCSDLTQTVSKPIHFQQRSEAVLFHSRNCFESSVPSVNRSPVRYTSCDAPFHYLVQCEHSLTFCTTAMQQSLHHVYFLQFSLIYVRPPHFYISL